MSPLLRHRVLAAFEVRLTRVGALALAIWFGTTIPSFAQSAHAGPPQKLPG